VSFTVLPNERQLVRFSLEGAVLACSDDRDRQAEGFTTSRRNRIPIRASRFAFGVEREDGAISADVAGSFRGSRATGAIEMTAFVNRDNELDPDGSVRCTSGAVRWAARRR
jgi:hypothetical protein